jgi:hypothetical protein
LFLDSSLSLRHDVPSVVQNDGKMSENAPMCHPERSRRTNTAFSKQHSALFGRCEKSERIRPARTVTVVAVVLTATENPQTESIDRWGPSASAYAFAQDDKGSAGVSDAPRLVISSYRRRKPYQSVSVVEKSLPNRATVG